MNIHPIIVHFPIALLMVYAGCELVSLFSPSWKEKLMTTKLVCLWGGVIGSFLALQSGEVAQDLLGRSNLIHTHEERAEKSHSIFVILSIVYLIEQALKYNRMSKYFSFLTLEYRTTLTKILSATRMQWTKVILACLGVIILTIVGALGGAIVRGVGTGDPISDWAVKTFVGNSTGVNR